ncbi:MAG: 16S rRNA (cytosine(967)-C(5))-methyltransferase, partial [Gammaproteobacteria bacterium]|nr:16S rRNA (cytosine(967)-C(5))-methyltransferase [Gammaproteobacteria bacterium]
RLQAAWPAQASAILEANNQHPPMVLRVDRRLSADAAVQSLKDQGIDAHKIQWSETSVELGRPRPVSEVPGFAEGHLSIQDAGAQIAAALLDPQPGQRVLDACAAPGGKTGALLEYAPGIALTALDVTPERVARIEQNLRRLRREARLVCADLRRTADYWDGQPFDRILLDVPCSSTGVIRRHPDIKLLRRPSDTEAFGRLQRELLDTALTLLAPGGRLLYATCSLLREENEAVVAGVREGGRARLAPLSPAAPRPPGALPLPLGLQLLPGAEAGTDGFYYACLEKTTA